ncbi:aldo/keto reductase [Planococcus shixiaomingii]|uniref:aldo/keto reductase n=1 Tax=Planococcus shixiaomingii TaxID=3058393 RepID=UPI0026302EA6|nr:aldo/keto reductase [Planococcus sp. N022]WKA55004.1 aldo/keto reductase [Planococcus sp. N022]
MEYTSIPGIGKKASRFGVGTWPIGGAMWGGNDDAEALRMLHAAIDQGITVIDTAIDYGYGHSEQLVGKALKESGQREDIILSAKCGLAWKGEEVYRDATKKRITSEIEETLRNLQTDYIDVYFVHWPDPAVPVEETAGAMKELYDAGKITAIGVSNFTIDDMEAFRKIAPIHAIQPPYNLFEQEAEKDIFPYSQKHNATLFLYSSLCRGLLSGKMTRDREFREGDIRKDVDPKFQQPLFDQYLAAADKLAQFAQNAYGRPLIDLAVRYVLDQSETGIALRGARRPDQLEPLSRIEGWKLTDDDKKEIDRILAETIDEPAQPDFMAPPLKKEVLES